MDYYFTAVDNKLQGMYFTKENNYDIVKLILQKEGFRNG